MYYSVSTLRALWEKHRVQAKFCDEMYDQAKTLDDKIFWIGLANVEHKKMNHYLDLWERRLERDRRKSA